MEKRRIVSERIAGIAPSATLGIAAKTKAMKAEGKKVFGFAAGEPDFDTPAHIKEAAEKALKAGETKYTPTAGLKALCDVIAEKLNRDNNLPYKSGQVVVSNGAKHSLFNIFMTICLPGDEVIIPSPYWLSYPEMVNIAGGRPVFVQCCESNDFKMTAREFEKAITSRTKAVIMNSPSNPIGNVYTRGELEAIVDVAVKRRIFIVADEIYEKMVYDGAEHVSVGSFSKEAFDLTITVNGFSKTYAMTGWRLGYAAAPPEIAQAMDAFQGHATSGPNTFAQFGAIEALKGPQDCVAKMVKAFAERRAYIYQRLTAIRGVTCVNPRGAFYVLPNISKSGMGSVKFAEQLLEKEGVAVVPGISFGSDDHVRFSYACSMENIREGMDRFEKFMKSL